MEKNSNKLPKENIFSATAPSGQILDYKVENDHACIIREKIIHVKGDLGPSGDLIIPQSIIHNGKEYVVRKIDSWAFFSCRNLSSVTIPNTVESIGWNAFRTCTSLKGVVIPESVVKIGNSAFENCSGLTDIIIPETVKIIGRKAFFGCTSLTNVEFNARDCEDLESIFSGCPDISIDLVIGKSLVRTIGNNDLKNCNKITVADGNPRYDSRDNCNAIIETLSNTLVRGCKNTTIPDTITKIDDFAFSGCKDLTDIVIPPSVTRIGDSAFEGCTELINIKIMNPTTSIGKDAFRGCTILNK